MTPQEKAKELYDKFYEKCDDMYAPGYIQSDKRDAAKKCALIAVEELIDSQPFYPCPPGVYGNTELKLDMASKFWQQVKAEIEKI